VPRRQSASFTPDRQFQGKVALITGASRGIGLAIADALAAHGCNVIISGRDRHALARATKQLSQREVQVQDLICDVGDANSVDALFAAIRDRQNSLDFLVNNAGVAHPMTEIARMPLVMWQEVIATNLTGMFLCARAALPLMKRGAVIVNNLSVAAKGVFPGEAAYVASKHGALGFTRTLREELREKGIRVIALMPGPTDTEIWNQFWPDAPRTKMMSPATVATTVVAALALPENAAVDELVISPATGSL
jgi:NAD(P)-dependent dehydrogenase (short-subunit alcohol dehydrogenase family)